MKTLPRIIAAMLSGLLLAQVAQVAPAQAEADCECSSMPKTSTYRLRVLSRATSSACTDKPLFVHRVILCAPEGCVSEDVSNARRLTFRAAPGDSIKVESHARSSGAGSGGAASSARDVYSAGELGRFTQTVRADNDCLRSVVFELSRVRG